MLFELSEVVKLIAMFNSYEYEKGF